MAATSVLSAASELLLTTVDDGSSRPSFFEICLLDRTEAMLKPAFRHFFNGFVDRLGNGAVLTLHFDSLYAIFYGVLEARALVEQNSTFAESLYGFHRESNRIEDKNTTGRGIGRDPLSQRQKMASIAYVVLLPRILFLLKNWLLMARHRVQVKRENEARARSTESNNNNYNNNNNSNNNNSTHIESDQSRLSNTHRSSDSDTSSVRDTDSDEDIDQVEGGQSTGIMHTLHQISRRTSKSIENILDSFITTCADNWKILDMTMDYSCVAYQIMYLFGRSKYHHPAFAFFEMIIVKNSYERRSTFNGDSNPNLNSNSNSSAEDSSRGRAGSTPSFSTLLLTGALLALKTAHWATNSDLSSNNIREYLTRPITAPPFPKPSKIGRGALIPPKDPSLCAICRQVRKNPVAAPSGYVFCYSCLLPHVRKWGKCPVTLLRVTENDIIRLYEQVVREE